MHQHKNHNHHHTVNSKSLGFTVILNIVITLAQIIGGFISGSMALLSDAAHNFSDVVSLIVSFVANRLKNKKATNKHTFGYKRSEIVAAFVNSASLIGLSIVIIIETIKRFWHTPQISPYLIILLASLGVIANGLSVVLLKKDAKNNINIKSAFLHLLSDMLISVAVLIGGLCILFFKWYWVDAVFSLIISIYLIYASWNILRTSLKIIMQFAPIEINIEMISEEIEKITNIKNIHHIHLWQINEEEFIFEAHIDFLEDIKLSEVEKTLYEVKVVLKKFKITHSTLQPEFLTNDSKQKISNT